MRDKGGRDEQGRFLAGSRASVATEFKPGKRSSPATEFKKGERPSIATEFGQVPAHNKLPVGTVRVRTFKGKKRAWVKIAEPNSWQLRAVVEWTKVHGPVPKGSLIHHKNRDTLDDSFENLELHTRATHINEHRTELVGVRVARRSNVKTSWQPCARCGDPDGPVGRGSVTPDRISGKRFGIDGELCKRCYLRLYKKMRSK